MYSLYRCQMTDADVLTLEMLDGRRHTGPASGWKKLSALECSPLLSLCQPGGHDAGDHIVRVMIIIVISDESTVVFILT